MSTLEQLLADWRGRATVLRATKHPHDAELVDDICDQFAAATEEYRRLVSESDACLFSGKSVAWLRARFREWEMRGLAEWRDKTRYYRLCVLPRRADLAAAREAGLRGETRRAS